MCAGQKCIFSALARRSRRCWGSGCGFTPKGHLSRSRDLISLAELINDIKQKVCDTVIMTMRKCIMFSFRLEHRLLLVSLQELEVISAPLYHPSQPLPSTYQYFPTISAMPSAKIITPFAPTDIAPSLIRAQDEPCQEYQRSNQKPVALFP